MSVDDSVEQTDDNTFSIDSHDWSGEDLYQETKGGRRPESSDGDSADEVDPTKLVRQVSVDQIRWYYRNGAVASTLVDKPIDDAFKYGYTIRNDPTDSVQNVIDDLEWEFHYKQTQKKARRDGFAILLAVTKDTAETYEPPENVNEIVKLRTLTIEDLADGAPDDLDEILPDGYDTTDVVVTDNGLVVSVNFDDPDNYGDLLGVVHRPNKQSKSRLIHRERFWICPWRQSVDGDTDERTFGRYEGDSILQPVIHLIKGLHKGNWASMQALYRHSSPLHVLNPPEGVSEEHWNDANREMSNINSKSSFTLPPGGEWEMESVEGEVAVDPAPHFNAIFSQICAGTEMTKSVLFGTQSGTVSGSETDIKNYFNQVERLRSGRIEDDLQAFIRRVNQWDKSSIPNLSLGFEVDWEPLFRIETMEQMESMGKVVNALSTAITTYVLTPDEAREVLSEQWAELDIDVDMSELDETDFDQLDRVNTEWGKQYQEGASPEDEVEESPHVGQNGGGREAGNNDNSSNPTR